MTIKKEMAKAFFRTCGLRYGGVKSNPREDYKHIDLFSKQPLPIETAKEYDIASRIAKKHSLYLIDQDFSPGEGLQPLYQPVFATSCSKFDDLREGKKRIEEAEAELESVLEEI